jgi:hypothetical protein
MSVTDVSGIGDGFCRSDAAFRSTAGGAATCAAEPSPGTPRPLFPGNCRHLMAPRGPETETAPGLAGLLPCPAHRSDYSTSWGCAEPGVTCRATVELQASATGYELRHRAGRGGR